jgi:hypothetical protein
MKTMTTLLSFALGISLAACAASTEPGDGTSTPPPAASSTPPPAATGSAPEYAISCSGEITKRSFGTVIGPLCVGGPPGTFGCGDPCAAQAIEITYVPPANRCGSIDRFVWDGTTCKKYLTNDSGQMRCKGADCEKMFATEAACKTAYETCPPK